MKRMFFVVALTLYATSCTVYRIGQAKEVAFQGGKLIFGSYTEMQFLEPHPGKHEVFVDVESADVWVATPSGWLRVGKLVIDISAFNPKLESPTNSLPKATDDGGTPDSRKEKLPIPIVGGESDLN